MTQFEPVDLNNILTQVLDGQQQIVSYAGTSQYHIQDIGTTGSERTSISACGLIALNCARTVFRLHKEANHSLPVDGERDPIGFLRTVLSEQTTEEIISISSSWPSSEHLEVEDIFDVPLFKNAFNLAKTTYTQSRFSAFSQLLQDMINTRRDANDPVAVVITRPPEIIVCLIISTSLGNFFVVFDSHPRPLHPLGSAFIINHSLEATSRYLDELLAVDPKLFSDRSMRWQTDLLTHFEGHILVPRENSQDNLNEIVMAASIDILRLKADKADSRRRELSYVEEKRDLIKQINDLERLLVASSDHKGKQKASDYEFWVPPPGDPSSKKANKSYSSKAGKGSNRGWVDTRRNFATEGYQPQDWPENDTEPTTSSRGFLNSVSSWLTGNHTESLGKPGMNLNQDLQDDELVIASRESKVTSKSAVIKKPDYSALDQQMDLDDPPPSPTPPVQKPVNVSNEASANLAMELQQHYDNLKIPPNSDVIKKPDFSASRQIDLDDPSPSPTPPMQNPVDLSDVASSNLAMELQRLYDEEDRQLGAERSALQKKVQADFFDCGICFETFPRDNIARFATCAHRYCRSCLRVYVGSTLRERRYPITCPECKAKKSPKPAEVDDNLFHSLGPTPKDLEVFYELQLAAHSVTLHCRKCQRTMNVDRDEYQSISIITCPLPACNYTWCKDCQQIAVLGGAEHSCDGASELKRLIDKKGWKRCPGCQIPIQKSAGCHHMVCQAPGCNTHFCYVCGEKIIQSTGPGVAEALGAHYRKCHMFDYAIGADSDND